MSPFIPYFVLVNCSRGPTSKSVGFYTVAVAEAGASRDAYRAAPAGAMSCSKLRDSRGPSGRVGLTKGFLGASMSGSMGNFRTSHFETTA